MPSRDRPARPKPAAAASIVAPAPEVIDDVEDLLASASDDRDMIWVSRMENGEWALLERVPASALRAAGVAPTVQAKWGGGHYRARVRERGGAWGKSRVFNVAGEPKSETPAPTTGTVAALQSSAARELPSWVEKIVLPIGVALAAGITSKLLAEPKTDPLVLELLKLNAKGAAAGTGGVDALELQKIVMAAEDRGEKRGRELGELTAGGASDGGDGPLQAIREATPLITRLLDRSDAERRQAPATPPTAAIAAAPTTAGESVPVATPSAAPDIVPAWLRPFMTYKGMLLGIADAGSDPTLYADLVLDRAPDAAVIGMLEANAAGTLEQDLLRAMPELSANEKRTAFAHELVAAIAEGLEKIQADQGDAGEAADA